MPIRWFLQNAKTYLSFFILIIFLIIPTLVLAKSELPLNIDLRNIDYNVTRVHVVLTHETGIIKECDLTLDKANRRAYGTIKGLKAGIWKILVQLFEGNTIIGTGRGIAKIIPGRTTHVSISINLEYGNLGLEVTWGKQVSYRTDFEGELGKEWTLGGDILPTIANDETASGSHSLKLSCNNSQSSWAKLEINVPQDAYLRFYFKVESEQNYDFFHVYLDDEQTYYIWRWSGNVDWKEGKIALSPGTHLILFKFERDSGGGYGRNSVWIDDITLIATNLERSHGGHKYRYFSYMKDWHEAESYCENLGGHLAIIESAEENEFLTQNYAIPFLNGRPFLGGTDEEVEGVWKWIDGRTFDEVGYENWAPGEPNNNGDEDYLHFYNNGRWNDIDPDGNYYGNYWKYASGFLCEWDHE